jgi:tripartite-type tricarboxylate transporter receptor subunit TctC
MAAIDMVRVNYKGGGAAFNDLIAGQVQLMFPTAGSAAGHIRAGRLRALAVTSMQASKLVPGVPPASAALPGYESVSPFGIFVPAKTPAVVVRRLNRDIVAVLNDPTVKERFFAAGVETVGSSPQALADAMRSDMKRMGKVIRDSGIRAD